jgi:hypothetical protein
MRIRIKNGLPYTSAILAHHSQRVTLKNVLLDTGSAGSIFSTDKVAGMGLTYEPDDFVHRIRRRILVQDVSLCSQKFSSIF